MTFEEIKQLLEIVREHELSEFELERDDFKIRIRRHSGAHVVTLAPPAAPVAVGTLPLVAAAATAVPATQASALPSAATLTEDDSELEFAIVKSPIVGTFYRSPEPDAPSFVEVGDTIRKNQVLCIIEAMKLMNEITSEYEGEIVKCYVENGQPVQYRGTAVRDSRQISMFKKILVANRGEIALRVIVACRELGIKTVAVYSEADENSLHVRFADEDVCIGPAQSARSYLNVPAIISAAEITGADAIHPGYGFLSESAYLAEVCEACHIRFIGPSPQVIRLLGDKARARRAMRKAGVPILPGSDGPVDSEEKGLKVARDIGYPVMVKATAGGGGRGMRIVQSAEELGTALKTAQREAEAAFGVGDVYIEKYVIAPRHIEFQVLGDHHGSVVHLGERECSIQRRHQKLIEESPSVALTDKMRRKMGGIVVDAARAVQYTNAGTFEFLMDSGGRFYFMEVNTRLQVEHPVTEMVTGVDIVKEQIRIAAGERLSVKQSEITFTGHAIECRVNAEDPDTFRPSPGVIHAFSVPGGPGVRIDTCAHTECTISPYYDSLIAKVIVHGRDRQEAIARMRRTLEMTVIEGISTSIPLHLRLLAEPDFQAGRLSTAFMDRYSTAAASGDQLQAAG